MAAQTSTRGQEIRDIWTQYKFLYQIAGVILLVIVATYAGSLLFPADDGYWSNTYMTVIGVVITVGILDRLAERREEHREMDALKQQFLRDVRSTNEVAKNAIYQIREREWHKDEVALLKGMDLWEANLAGADLNNFNLGKVHGAKANLHKANLFQAKLAKANLPLANFQEADLGRADLEGAILWSVNLEGAILKGANLIETDLRDARFDEKTILPDGSTWKLNTDITCFTNPHHKDFWRSDDQFSPAYRRQ